MDRPHRLADRAVADAVRRTAAERAARAAHLARRRAAARRRAVLATTLVVLSLAGWGGVLAGGLLALGVAPTVLLATVLVLGRRAVVAARRADAAWAAGAPARAAVPRSTRPTAVGHARRPSDASTEVMARVPADRAEEVAAAEARAEAVAAADAAQAPEDAKTSADARTWAPVPVPRPTYSLKPAVRRPEPAPLVLDEREGAEAVARDAQADGAAEAGRENAAETAQAAPETATAGFDLDAVLARRRAAGE